MIETKENGGVFHVGCWAKINHAIIAKPTEDQLLFMREPLADQIKDGKVTFQVKKCTHSTPAEDGAFFSFMHRKYGCPDEGAKWPKASKALGFE